MRSNNKLNLICYPCKLISVLNGSESCNLFKNIPECLNIIISHRIHHFVDGFMARLQTSFCCFDFNPLNVFYWCIIRGLFKSSDEASFSDRKFAGKVVHRDLLVHVLFDKQLDSFHIFITVIFFVPQKG